MKILIELEIENEVEDTELLLNDLDDCLSEFAINNEQTYFTKSNFLIK